MKEEIINELLEKLKQCDDYHNRCDFLMEHDEITYMLDYITNLQKENEELKEKIKNYENPKDLTLMFMYCDEKAKDKIKELKERINKAIEFVEEHKDLNIIGSETIKVYSTVLLKILKGEENAKN